MRSVRKMISRRKSPRRHMRRYDGDWTSDFAARAKSGLKTAGSSIASGAKALKDKATIEANKLLKKKEYNDKINELKKKIKEANDRDNYINGGYDADIKNAETEKGTADINAETEKQRKIRDAENKKQGKIRDAKNKKEKYENNKDVISELETKIQQLEEELKRELKKIENPTQVDGRRRRRSRSKRRRSKRRSDGKKRRHSKRKW